MPWRWVSRRHSITARIVVLIAGYVLALGAVYAGFSLFLVDRDAARANERLEQTARLVAAEIDAYVESGRQRLATVTRLPGMTYGLGTIQEASGEGRIPPWTTLHYLFFKSPIFTGGVCLLDRSGKVLWTEPPGQGWMGKSLADYPAVAALYESKRGFISHGLTADLLLDRPHVVLSAPVLNPNGEIDGALAGVIDLTAPEFTKFLRALSRTEGRFVEVVDQGDRVIAGSEASRLFQPARTASPPGGEWMLAASPLTQAPWQVVAGQSRTLALAEVRQFQQLLLTIGFGLVALAVAVGAPLVMDFVGSIRNLTAAAETIGRGDLSRPVAVGRHNDELTTLARSFEQMRVELGRSRVALERRLEEREELIQVKETFLANISHELRTPLNAIIGYADMLAEQSLEPEGREFLTFIRAHSLHLYDLLSDLLTLAGMNLGKLPVEVSPVHIPTLMARLKPLVEPLRSGKPIEVEWDCPPSLPMVETDPLRLEQILTNLIANAFKFTSQGQVAIRARHEPQQEHILFEVKDTGIGIPEHEIAHIFDEFRQVDGSLTRAYGGVGLGLALVKKLTLLLRGAVTVHSSVGEGSSFTVVLPLRIELAPASSDAGESDGNRGSASPDVV